MSQATDLAKECGAIVGAKHITDSCGDGVFFDPDELETFFRRAQAMALIEAAGEFVKGDPAPKHWAVIALHQMADELERTI